MYFNIFFNITTQLRKRWIWKRVTTKNNIHRPTGILFTSTVRRVYLKKKHQIKQQLKNVIMLVLRNKKKFYRL